MNKFYTILILVFPILLIGQDYEYGAPLDTVYMANGDVLTGMIHKASKKNIKFRQAPEWKQETINNDEVDNYFKHEKADYWKVLNSEDGRLTYSRVFESKGSANELYDRALLWFTEHYNSSEAVIEMENREGHTIVGNGINGDIEGFGYFKYGPKLKLTTKIQTKNGRAKITINQLLITPIGGYSAYVGDKPVTHKTSRSDLLRVLYKIDEQIDNIEQALNNNADSDW